MHTLNVKRVEKYY